LTLICADGDDVVIERRDEKYAKNGAKVVASRPAAKRRFKRLLQGGSKIRLKPAKPAPEPSW